MPASRKNRNDPHRQSLARHAGEPVACSSPPCYSADVEAGRLISGGPSIRIKRIYDAPAAADGFRVLVDRLWPRGVARERAALDAWARELAPGTALRQWLHADPARWSEFCLRYRAELQHQRAALEALRQRALGQPITLLYAAKDRERNHASVLRDVLSAPPIGDYA